MPVDTLILIAEVIAVLAVLGLALYFLNRRIVAYYDERPHLTFRRQLIQAGLTLVIVLFIILFLPVGTELRGQLLRLYGLVFSATIALSSTTLVGNVMAGFMLKMIDNLRLGNYITVGDYFGRITEMDLLHTEIQTEERDLTTLPNLYLVTHPVRVMRASGTLLSVSVSLGYDVSRHRIEQLMVGAATAAGLTKPYVQITNLGDFSVTYQVSALLEDVNRLIDKRRELRARTMDALHDDDIEIVSPTFMNTRSLATGRTFISRSNYEEQASADMATSPDAVAFDKAERAESVSRLRERLSEAEERLKACTDIIADPPSEQAKAAAETEKATLESRVERLKALILRKEAQVSKDK